MIHQRFVIACVSVLLSTCAAVDEEVPATTEASLRTLSGLTAVSQASPALRTSIVRAGLRLCDLQADRFGDSARNGLVDDDPDDGGWDWQTRPSASAHSSEASATNLYGATALGVWAALQTGAPRPRLGAALSSAYRGIEQNPEVASAPDISLLALMSERFFDERYAELARERYDGRVAAAGDASSLAASIRDARHGAGADGLIAYDLAWFALGALALGQKFPRAGYFADFQSYSAAVIEDLTASTPNFDYRDAHEHYYVTGLAWSMLVSSWMPRSRVLFAELRSLLLDRQLSDGAWPHNADFPAGNLQATAHALIALGLASHGDATPPAVGGLAADWLISQQNENGGWPYTQDEEFPLLDAEAALGLSLVRAAQAQSVAHETGKAQVQTQFAPPVAHPIDLPVPAAPEQNSAARVVPVR